jgi:hypothetical protein
LRIVNKQRTSCYNKQKQHKNNQTLGVDFVTPGTDVPDLLDQQAGEDLNITIAKSANKMNSEITSFTDQNPSFLYQVDSQPDETFSVADQKDVTLGKFLSRPVLIQSFDWATGAPNIYERFNPWKDFFSDSRIANRIAHYAFLRCKLRVRVLINGNQFHFGRAILSYIPLPGYDELTKDRVFVREDIVQASQRPHIYIDPTYSQGGELALPYFYPKNMLEIANSEYDQMGEMVLHTINVLKHANGADDNVTINIFAWAEDVVLSGPTNATSDDLSPQSGEDEYGQGIVSKPAGIVARVAKKLTSIPPIAPYARATELAAGSVAQIASMLGYCRPNDISTILSVKPQYGGNMANTNLEDTAIKLSVDAKQELTLDPRTVGLSGVDELGIKNLAQRESYLTTFDWQVSDLRDQKLFGIAVTPGQTAVYSGGLGANEAHATAMAFASLPFQWWRGTIKFRFQIVASNYHRGRIRVVYEPFDTAPSLDYTTNYNRIIDLAEEKDFTVEIGWNQNVPYKQMLRPLIDGEPFGPTFVNPFASAFSNGMLSLHVVNDLTVPNSTVNNDIQVNVFVSAGDDFEVAGPAHDNMRRYTFYDPIPPALDAQVGEDVVDLEKTTDPSAPMKDTDEFVGSTQMDDNDKTNHVFFGEEIKSFRPLLKRYALTLHETSPEDATGNFWWRLRLPAFPLSRGYVPVSPAVFPDVNVCEMTLLNWVSAGFTGWRGGIRHKLFVGLNDLNPNSDESSKLTFASVTREQMYTTGNPYSNAFSTVDATSRVGTLLTQQGVANNFFNGGTANPLNRNPVQDIEVPFYSNWRFLPSKRDSNNVNGLFRVNPPTYQLLVRADGAEDRPQVSDFVATGEDFNLFFFTGCPVFYRGETFTPA